MNTTRTIILPTLGLVTLIFFIGLSYLTNNIFFEKLLICGFILFIVFIARIRETLKS